MGKSFPNPMTRGLRKMPHEASRLRSERDPDVVERVWQYARKDEQNVARLAQAVEQLQRQINRLRMRGGGSSDPAEDPRDWFMGVWDSGTQYYAQQAVEYTPTGGQAGIYIALTDPDVGTAPDTGAPDWYAWPIPIHSKWAF